MVGGGLCSWGTEPRTHSSALFLSRAHSSLVREEVALDGVGLNWAMSPLFFGMFFYILVWLGLIVSDRSSHLGVFTRGREGENPVTVSVHTPVPGQGHQVLHLYAPGHVSTGELLAQVAFPVMYFAL